MSAHNDKAPIPKDMMEGVDADNRAMVPYKEQADIQESPTESPAETPTELADRDMAMMRQFIEATQNKKAIGDNIRKGVSVDTNNAFISGIAHDYRVFRGAIDVARQEKIDALEMVADHVERTKQMRKLTTAELKRVLVKQQHLLDMLRELREGSGVDGVKGVKGVDGVDGVVKT